MTTLLLRLAAPMQSWGDDSHFAARHTRLAPTKSGVLGLLAAAEGRWRTDPIADLAKLKFGVRVDQPGRVITDFQTAIRWRDGESMPLSTRYYVADAVYVAAVEGDNETIAGVVEAVQAPSFPLYLGRRSCPVVGDVFLGVTDQGLEDALRSEVWHAAKWHRSGLDRSVSLDLFLDAAPGEGDEVVRDVPLSYDPERRAYGWREVLNADPVEVINPDARAVDYFKAVAG